MVVSDDRLVDRLPYAQGGNSLLEKREPTMARGGQRSSETVNPRWHRVRSQHHQVTGLTPPHANDTLCPSRVAVQSRRGHQLCVRRLLHSGGERPSRDRAGLCLSQRRAWREREGIRDEQTLTGPVDCTWLAARHRACAAPRHSVAQRSARTPGGATGDGWRSGTLRRCRCPPRSSGPLASGVRIRPSAPLGCWAR